MVEAKNSKSQASSEADTNRVEIPVAPHPIAPLSTPSQALTQSSCIQRRIRDSAGRVVLERSPQERIAIAADQVSFYQKLEREGKGDILQPEGTGGALIWAPKRSKDAVEAKIQETYGVSGLVEILRPPDGGAESFYVNTTGTNRIGALMEIAKTGSLNGQVLGLDDMKAVKAELAIECGRLEDKIKEKEDAIEGVIDFRKFFFQSCSRNFAIERIPKELRAPFQTTLNQVNLAISQCSDHLAALEAAANQNEDTTASSAPAATSATSSTPPANATAAGSLQAPATATTTQPQEPKPSVPPQVAEALKSLKTPNSRPAQQVMADFITSTSKAIGSAAIKFQTTLAVQRLEELKRAEVLNNYYTSNLNLGQEDVEHTINISGNPDRNVRIDFQDKNGERKSFVYNVHNVAPMGESTALLAAQQGIQFEKTNLPSGNPESVKIIFTQPGTYNVNGEEVVVGNEGPQLTPDPRTPYQEFSIGRDAKSAHLKLKGQSFQEVNLSSLQPGQSRKVENNLEVHRLESGELRIRCFDGGQLEVVTALADGRQSSFSYAVKEDPNMLRYYELQQEIAKANEITDNAERFTALHACTAKVRLLAEDLASPYKEKIENSLKEAQTAMWDNALNQHSCEDFLKKLSGYEDACEKNDTLYQLPEELKTRLRRDAKLKAKPASSSDNPFD